MMRTIKGAVIWGGAVIIGVLAGFAWAAHGRQSEDWSLMTQTYALGDYETLTSLEYQNANVENGKRALHEIIDFMQQTESLEGNAIGKGLEIDRAMTNMRLALLEEKQGNKQESQDFVKRAMEGLRKSYGAKSTMTESDLRSAVLKLDGQVRYGLPAIFILRQSKK